MKNVDTGSPIPGAGPPNSASICAGVVVLSNSNPVTVLPAEIGEPVVNWIACAPLVSCEFHPAGIVTFVAAAGRNPFPGIQLNQNVPIVVLPVSFNVRSY